MPARRRDRLESYRAKRDFASTPEPAGGRAVGTGGRAFVVQKHAARRLHYDLRLQFGNRLRSWAVPQGPSLDPKVRRLAVRVEDHPLDYLDFEATIPEGQYGAGAMIVWDRGTWVPMGDAEADYEAGTIKFRLAGEKLGGGWTLVRIGKGRAKGDDWLLIKERDLFARPETEGDILVERAESVLSGRPVEALAPAKAVAASQAPARPAQPVRAARLKGARRAPLPAVVRPQLAAPASEAPAGDHWLHEIKLDGYRTIAHLDGETVRLLTRGGHDWTERYGTLGPAFASLAHRRAAVDGEVVVQDAAGRASFADLQEALAERCSHALTFYAFDLLHLDGFDLADVALGERKRALAGLIAPLVGPTSQVQLSEHVLGDGPAFFAEAARLGLEGVVAKRIDAPYRPGRSRSWLKIKCRQVDDFVVVGFTESAAAGGLAALLLAEAGPDGLRYLGRVGTGFSRAEAERLVIRLRALRQDQPAVALPAEDLRPGPVFVRPALLAQVGYATRTADGRLRHAVYQGLRLDQPATPVAAPTAAVVPRSVVAPEEAGGPGAPPRPRRVSDADLAAIWVTNPDRVMFDGPTKLELALYYARVGDWLLPELVHRPLSLVRCPTGKVADCFFQRHAAPGLPAAVRQIALAGAEDENARGHDGGGEGREGRSDQLYLQDARGLLALAQFGAVEFHVWGCRVDRPERPDRLVLDLDPDDGLPWRAVADGAREVAQALDGLGLVPFLKTTGGKGLHVVVPLRRRAGWSELSGFAQAFAARLARRAPARFTAQLSRRARRGRIFLDHLRNRRGATAVVAYSLRARPGAPVATPIGWAELDLIDDPAEFDYATVAERLAGGTDPWLDLERSARTLTKDLVRKLPNQTRT